MKSILTVAAAAMIAATAMSGPGQAAGCLKGAAAGGIAGHFLGHHGVIGAGVGCLIGRHNANKQARQEQREQNNR